MPKKKILFISKTHKAAWRDQFFAEEVGSMKSFLAFLKAPKLSIAKNKTPKPVVRPFTFPIKIN